MTRTSLSRPAHRPGRPISDSTSEVRRTDGVCVIVEVRVRTPSVQVTFSDKATGIPRCVRMVPMPQSEQAARELLEELRQTARSMEIK